MEGGGCILACTFLGGGAHKNPYLSSLPPNESGKADHFWPSHNVYFTFSSSLHVTSWGPILQCLKLPFRTLSALTFVVCTKARISTESNQGGSPSTNSNLNQQITSGEVDFHWYYVSKTSTRKKKQNKTKTWQLTRADFKGQGTG